MQGLFSIFPLTAFANTEAVSTESSIVIEEEEEVIETEIEVKNENENENESESESESEDIIESSPQENKEENESKLSSSSIKEDKEEVEYDAHCFIRYDSTNQKEDGTTHYSYENYFPIGEYKSTDKSDVSSPDAKVAFVSGEEVSDYVGNSENVITNGNVNLYKKENGEPLFEGATDSTTLEEYFKNVYAHIVIETMASDEIIEKSISTWLKDEKYGEAYRDGKIKVLWYVIKTEPDGYHIDGVLYWATTGDIVDTEDDPDDPIYNPEPEPEPIIDPDPEPNLDPDPIPTIDPEPGVHPIEPTVIKPEPESEPSSKSVQKTNLEKTSPQTGDETNFLIWSGVLGITTIILILIIGLA